MDPTPPTHVGRYELLNRLGEGGMGVVYLARDPLLGRTVAIKVLSAYNEELRYRFAREARSSAGLKHNNIVTIYDIGDDQGKPFIAMEYLDGETMAELVKRRAPMSIVRKLQLVLELCAGLGYAHRNGIIHRDIKPANVMITADGVLKILDFGLARLATEAGTAGYTRVGALLGTPQYMSPEQIEGKPLDQRSDIFAVGLVLYEFLSYRKAYAGETPHAVLNKILNTDPQPVREIVPDVDAEVEIVIAKAIEKDPGRRYQRLDLMATDLERIRTRIRTSHEDKTVPLDRPSAARPSPAGEDAAPSPRNLPNLSAIAKRRAAQIQFHLDQAQRRLDAGEYDQAIEQCEAAAIIDPDDRRVIALFERACRAAEDKRVHLWLDEAQRCVSRGALSEAERLVDQALHLRPALGDAQVLQRDVKDRLRQQERAAERATAARIALERARVKFTEGAFRAAVRSADEALAYDANNDDARRLKQQAEEVLAEEQRRQEHEQHALDVLEQGRMLAGAGQLHDARDLLRAFEPRHDLVDAAVADLESRIEAGERRQREEAAARQRAIEDEQRQKRDHDARAAATISESRVVADGGGLREALELLRGFDPPHADVEAAIGEIEARIEAEERWQREEAAARQRATEEEQRQKREHERLAQELLAGTRAAIDAWQLEAALERLRGFEPPHEVVTAAIADIEARIEVREQSRREEEAARQRAIEEERRRQEEERLAREREQAEEARRRREHQARAEALVAEMRGSVEAGRFEAALARLREFEPPHEVVTAAIAEVEARIEAEEQRRREDEAARQRAIEEERRRQEEERLAREREQAEEARRRREHQTRADALVAEIRGSVEAGRFEEALARLREFGPPHADVQAAIADVEARIEAEEQRQREAAAARQRAIEEEQRAQREHQRRAAEVVATSRRMAAEENWEDALSLLRAFEPSHSLVTAAIVDLEAELEVHQRRRREEEAARQRGIAEQQRREEAERLKRERDEATRKAAEAKRQQAEDEKRRREAERRREFDDHLAAAAKALESGELQTALASVQAALTIFKQDEQARLLNQQVREALDEQKRQARHHRAAETAVAKARRLSSGGDFPGAIRALEKFQPAALVAPVLDELKHEWRAREERREEEAARKRQQALEDQQRADEERRRREDAEAERQRVEEAERQRQLEVRRVAEAAARKAAEDARRAEEEERRRAEEAALERTLISDAGLGTGSFPALPDQAPSPAVEENLQFTVFRPASVAPETWHRLLVFAHLSSLSPEEPVRDPDPIAEVRRQAVETLGDVAGHREHTVDGRERVPPQAELTLIPSASGVEFDPPARSFHWDRQVHREEFRLKAAAALQGSVVLGRVSVYCGSIIIAEIGLVMKVDAGLDREETVRESTSPYRRIFASYSHRDAAIVEEYAEYARAMGDRYQQDVIDLRSGETWQPRVRDLIREADAFQLFWSWNALESRQVREEWSYALSLGRESFVRPVYWQDPLPSRGELPPATLRDLHFRRIQPRAVAGAGTFDARPLDEALARSGEPEPPPRRDEERAPESETTADTPPGPEIAVRDRITSRESTGVDWRSLVRSRTGVIVLALVAVAAIVVSFVLYRNRTPPNTDTAKTSTQPGPKTAPEPPTTPVGPPPGPPPPSTSVVMAPLVIDAVPWGEVVEIRPTGKDPLALEGTPRTPVVLDVPVGEYSITLRNTELGGTPVTVRATVTAGGGRNEPVVFKDIKPIDYLKKVGSQ